MKNRNPRVATRGCTRMRRGTYRCFSARPPLRGGFKEKRMKAPTSTRIIETLREQFAGLRGIKAKLLVFPRSFYSEKDRLPRQLFGCLTSFTTLLPQGELTFVFTIHLRSGERDRNRDSQVIREYASIALSAETAIRRRPSSLPLPAHLRGLQGHTAWMARVFQIGLRGFMETEAPVKYVWSFEDPPTLYPHRLLLEDSPHGPHRALLESLGLPRDHEARRRALEWWYVAEIHDLGRASVEALDLLSAQGAGKVLRRRKGEWLAQAMLLLNDDPNRTDVEIAKTVGISPGRLSQIEEWRNLRKSHRRSPRLRVRATRGGRVAPQDEEGAGEDL